MNERLSQAEQLKLLQRLEPGDLFKFGKLMPGLAPNKEVEWHLVERTLIGKEGQQRERFLFRMYFFGVFLGQAVVVVMGDRVLWG